MWYRPRANNQNLNYVFPGGATQSWKGKTPHNHTTNSAVPTSSRPQNNLSVYDSSYNRSIRVNGKGPLNPIKHWRKQLVPSQGIVSGKPSLDQVMWQPGGSVYLGNNPLNLNTTDCSQCAPSLKTYLYNYYVDTSCCDVKRNVLSNFQPVTFNDPARVIRPRSSQTLLKKNYYTTGRAYLKSRVKLYEQNQLLSAIPGNTYAWNSPEYKAFESAVDRPHSGAGQGHNPSMYLPPSNSLTTGSQAFHSTNCISDPSACCMGDPSCATFITYKPSNLIFNVQGAVSSGTRILDIKRRAIVTNNSNFSAHKPNGEKKNLSVNGEELPGSTPINYRGNTDAPYFIKSKYQQIDACQTNCGSCYKISTHSKTRIDGRMPSGGSGIKTVCFPTGPVL